MRSCEQEGRGSALIQTYGHYLRKFLKSCTQLAVIQGSSWTPGFSFKKGLQCKSQQFQSSVPMTPCRPTPSQLIMNISDYRTRTQKLSWCQSQSTVSRSPCLLTPGKAPSSILRRCRCVVQITPAGTQVPKQ